MERTKTNIKVILTAIMWLLITLVVVPISLILFTGLIGLACCVIVMENGCILFWNLMSDQANLVWSYIKLLFGHESELETITNNRDILKTKCKIHHFITKCHDGILYIAKQIITSRERNNG